MQEITAKHNHQYLRTLKGSFIKHLDQTRRRIDRILKKVLSHRKLNENKGNADKLARDLERLLYKTSSGLQVVRVALLPLQCLARIVALQLKLLLKVNYLETIQNARKLPPLFQQVDTPTVAVSQVQPRSGKEYLRDI